MLHVCIRIIECTQINIYVDTLRVDSKVINYYWPKDIEHENHVNIFIYFIFFMSNWR